MYLRGDAMACAQEVRFQPLKRSFITSTRFSFISELRFLFCSCSFQSVSAASDFTQKVIVHQVCKRTSESSDSACGLLGLAHWLIVRHQSSPRCWRSVFGRFVSEDGEQLNVPWSGTIVVGSAGSDELLLILGTRQPEMKRFRCDGDSFLENYYIALKYITLKKTQCQHNSHCRQILLSFKLTAFISGTIYLSTSVICLSMIHTRIHFPNYQVTASLYHTLLTNGVLFGARRIHHGNKPTFITRNKPTPTSQSDKFNLPGWLLAHWRLSCCSLPYSIHSIIIASRPAGCNAGILPFGSSFSYLRNIC